MGKAVRIGYAGIVLEGVEAGIGKAAAVFHNRRDAEGRGRGGGGPRPGAGGEAGGGVGRREADAPTGQKPGGRAGEVVGDLVGAVDGRRETTEVVIETVEPSLGAAV